ncbi:MAG: hypothetical protein ACJ8AO_19560 [Gemmatimonadaceae bacterium]
MYSTCLFCHAALGSNETVESFPIGKRLAFDAAKGRLWVVCDGCGRWNLTPIEERWEAIEQCERAFRATFVRVSTDNVGLAKLRDGTELVRIGRPLRPEFAAWRYGSQFGKRRRRLMLAGGAGVAVTAAAGVALAPTLVPALTAMGVVYLVPGFMSMIAGAAIGGASVLADHVESEWVVARVPGSRGRALTVRQRHLDLAELRSGARGVDDLRLELPHETGVARFEADDAARVTCALLARVNRKGATTAQVQQAVGHIESSGDASGWLAARARILARRGPKLNPHRFWIGALHLRRSEQLTLEMALHEESERAALEGELARLADAWREAEEIAAIADSLLLPSEIDRQIEADR